MPQVPASRLLPAISPISRRQQAPDHPIVWGIPETSYLKFLIFQVV